MALYPTVDDLIKGTNPENLLEIHRSLWSLVTWIFLIIFLAMVVYALNYFFSEFRIPLDVPIIRNFSLRWLAVIPAWATLELIRRFHDDLYVVGLERIKRYQGQLSLEINIPTVKYADIKSVVVRQNIFGRMFNVGDLELSTAAQDTVELLLEGIAGPRELAGLIEALRHYNLKSVGLETNSEERAQAISE